ncbi:hypothetical protein LguiB_008876 [Lonicera macranthoides]
MSSRISRIFIAQGFLTPCVTLILYKSDSSLFIPQSSISMADLNNESVSDSASPYAEGVDATEVANMLRAFLRLKRKHRRLKKSYDRFAGQFLRLKERFASFKRRRPS